MRLWVTRTQPGADATAMRLRQIGHHPVVQPVLETRALAGAAVDLSEASAIAFTSPNAVAAFAGLTPYRGLPVFATGEATAQAACDIGFRWVEAADGGLAELAELIGARVSNSLVVWPRPTEPAGDLGELLAPYGVETRAQAIYETAPTNLAAPRDIDGLIVHSPKAARIVAGMLDPESTRGLTLLAISAAAAAPLAGFPFARVAVAPLPNETALLSLFAA